LFKSNEKFRTLFILNQAENRIQGNEDKEDIIGKGDKYIEERMKKCEWNMQKLCNSIKRPKQ
jgi:hypothetical protein